MDRRQFLSLSATGLVGLGLYGCSKDNANMSDSSYSIVILGDTHFDTEPDTVYHSYYNEPTEWLNNVQRAEFARNGEMWRERCPRLLKRAAKLIGDDTRMVFQMGDLNQGDCGNGSVHRQMLDDVMNSFKTELGSLPFITVVGNHDIRGTDAEATYRSYMPARLSQELGKSIKKTTFAFTIEDDAFIFIDFNAPDDAEIERLLQDTQGARHTFIVSHGPIFPYDDSDGRWIFHGSNTGKETDARRHFRTLFAQRNAIVLCGHTHCTEFADWHSDDGRITQMTMNSVWSSEGLKNYVVNAQGSANYGKNTPAEKPLYDEYRPGLWSYSRAYAAGCYKMFVSKDKVTINFYGGDSETISQVFTVR